MDTSDELQRCIAILKQGGLLVAPTDTVYGLVCDATNPIAVQKLIQVKNRPAGKPISVFADGFEMIEELVDTKNHKTTLKSLLPGPFTVILPSTHIVSPLLESENNTLGVRFTTSDWIQKLVHLFGKPLTATSANISGRPPHYEASGFIEELPQEKKNLIDHIVDFGKLPHNKPSTVVDLSGGTIQLLRTGEISPLSEESFITHTPEETKKCAQFLIDKHLKKSSEKPLVYILDGEMGVGKTVFAQGLGDYLGTDHIISPTYVVYYEYPVKKNNLTQFIHADLYNIQEAEEFKSLGLTEYLKKGVMLCIEWGERVGPVFDHIKAKAQVVFLELAYLDEHNRKITVKEL